MKGSCFVVAIIFVFFVNASSANEAKVYTSINWPGVINDNGSPRSGNLSVSTAGNVTFTTKQKELTMVISGPVGSADITVRVGSSSYFDFVYTNYLDGNNTSSFRASIFLHGFSTAMIPLTGTYVDNYNFTYAWSTAKVPLLVISGWCQIGIYELKLDCYGRRGSLGVRLIGP